MVGYHWAWGPARRRTTQVPVLIYRNRRAGVTWACGLAELYSAGFQGDDGEPCVAIAPDLIADFGDGG
jgi:hypothetical protein